ncbi:MAG: hypothetical protein JW892_03115 [Anaerolineae bacterium]|nr:hypothetical protein [Anaerolineae bacterium]
MAFRPNVHDTLTIGDATYVVAEHPAAPGMPYGQEGRAGVVYRLLLSLPETEDGGVALKVLRPRFRTPSLVSQAEKLETYAALPGLQVCRRTVLTRVHNADLLQQHPDLIYAVLMPWIAGPTWLEVLLDKRPLTFEQALSMARAFAEILESMELRGVAHCDLSGPNVLLPALANHGPQTAGSSPSSAVALVDVEGLYAPGLLRPEALPSGSSGYAHRTAHEGLWSPTADRFAGAILLAEMLGWGDENVRSAAWSETYFDPDEMPGRASTGTPHPERYQILLVTLHRHYGENVASLLERAWHSETLADCPTFGEWLVALPEKMTDRERQTAEDQSQTIVPPEPLAALLEKATDYELQTTEDQPQTIEPPVVIGGSSNDTTAATIRALMQAAQTLEEENNLIGALGNYRQAQSLAAAEPGILTELNAIVRDLEQRIGQVSNLGLGEHTVAFTPHLFEEEESNARDASPLTVESELRGEAESYPQRRQGWIWALGLISILLVAVVFAVQNSYQVKVQTAINVQTQTRATEIAQTTAIAQGRATATAAARATATAQAWSVTSNTENVLEIQLLNAIHAHDDRATAVAISPGGELLASGSDDTTIKLWNIANGSLLFALNGHTSYVWGLDFSPDGTMLVSASDDNTIKLWNVSDGSLIRTIKSNAGFACVEFSPDGSLLASGSVDSTVKLWDPATGREVRTLHGHGGDVFAVAFSPDGGTLASASEDHTVVLWRVSDGTFLRTLEGHTDTVWDVAFSPDGQSLASGSADGTVLIRRVADGNLLKILNTHTDGVGSVDFFPQGDMLVSAAGSWGNPTMWIWAVPNGVLLEKIDVGGAEVIRDLALDLSGHFFATVSHDGYMRVWGVEQ